jgi:hypothetical protein
METTPLTSGFFCPDHGIFPDSRFVRGSILPHCPRCDRIVTQVEDTDGEAF